MNYPCEANSPEFCPQKQYNSTIENLEILLNLAKSRSRIIDELGLPLPFELNVCLSKSIESSVLFVIHIDSQLINP